MRIKFKILLLLPLSLSLFGCSNSDRISFKCGGTTFYTYFNDRYFNADNGAFHEEIALPSMAMALATFNGDEDYSKRSNDLRDLWKKEGFENIWFNDYYYVEPETDSIAFGVASKTVQLFGGKYTIIAIAVRGGNYDAEWTSNVTLGYRGDAQGFSEARDQVIEGVTDFLNNYSIEGHVKFWIAGYSRAAITSNMTAGYILNKVEEGELLSNKVHYGTSDVYAYCFEPPMGVYTSIAEATKPLYKGIHNIINYNDLVPLVAPYEWGFTRYGTDHYYPDRLTDIYFDETEREKLVSRYHFTYGAQDFPKYTVDDWKFFDVGEEVAELNNLPRESVNPSLGRFCRAFIHELAVNGFGSRSMYSLMIESGIRQIMATVMGQDEYIEGIDLSAFVDIVFEYAFLRNLVYELQNDDTAGFALDSEMLFLQLFGANEDNLEHVKDLYENNFFFLTLFASAFSVRKDVLTQLLYRDNAMMLVLGHQPALAYCFLEACDSRIMGDKACKYNDGTYDVLHIESPKDFTIIEKNLKKDVFSYQNGVMTSSHLAAEKFNDGSINVYLPRNGDYEVIGSVGHSSFTTLDPLGNEEAIANLF